MIESVGPAPVTPPAHSRPSGARGTQASDERAAQRDASNPPPKLTIELDTASRRFVQTLFDGGSEEVLRRYPDEGQIAFSRGVNAYVRALQRAEFQDGK